MEYHYDNNPLQAWVGYNIVTPYKMSLGLHIKQPV